MLKFGTDWKEEAIEYLSWKGLEATEDFITWAEENNMDPTLDGHGDVIDSAFSDVITTIITNGNKNCLENE